MRTIYTHTDGGREMRLQTRTEPDEPLARFTLDAPGERAVSHELRDQSEVAGLVAAITPLYREQPQQPRPPDPGLE